MLPIILGAWVVGVFVATFVVGYRMSRSASCGAVPDLNSMPSWHRPVRLTYNERAYKPYTYVVWIADQQIGFCRESRSSGSFIRSGGLRETVPMSLRR